MTSLEQRAVLVKNEASSVSTCTPATVLYLNELLISENLGPAGKDITLPATSREPLRATAKQSKTKPSTTKASKLKAQEVNAQLSTKARVLLATETINFTIKALDNAIKNPSEGKRLAQVKARKRSASRQTLRRSTSMPFSPLPPRTLERTNTSPITTTKSSRSSSTASIEAVGPRCVAECARLAFACLRSAQDSGPSCAKLPSLKLESGMSALIGKCILLGLDDLAVKELRLLKRRLDAAFRGSNTSAAAKSVAKSSAIIAAPSLADMLVFPGTTEDVPTLVLAISTQVQVLRLIGNCRKPQLLADVLSALQVDRKGSPTCLLMQLGRQSTMHSAKASKQLDSVSLLVLSLTPSISSSVDASVSQSKTDATAEVAFQLQSLAYQIRTCWWDLAGHKPDHEKELLDPLSRCMLTFARRCQGTPAYTYQTANAVFSRFRKHIVAVKPHPRSPATTIYKVLSSLAQEAAAYGDAIKYTSYLEKIYTSSEASDVQLCTVTARLATLKLRMSPGDPDIEELVAAVLGGMEGPLKGDSQELDELVLELATLRKTTIQLVAKQRSEPRSLPLSDKGRKLCESLILMCPRFVLRYLGKQPVHNAVPKAIIAYEQRRRLVAGHVYPTIDSSLYLIKVYRNDNILTWELLDSTLQDGLMLLEATAQYLPKSESIKAAPSYAVKISHLYYTHFLDLQRAIDGENGKQRVHSLMRSIECVRSGSQSDKAAAFVNTKLERLTNIYAALNRHREAHETAISLRSELISSGALLAVAGAASSQPLLTAWKHGEDAVLLANAVVLLVRTGLKLNSVTILSLTGEEDSWSPEECGIMLELVLDALASQTKDVTSIVSNVATELLNIYDNKQFPIRRLRVLVELLNCGYQCQNLKEDVRSTLAAGSIDALLKDSCDTELQKYGTHLRAFVSSSVELREDHPRIDLTRQYLETWGTLLDDCNSAAILAERVDNIPKLISHLTSISDFLALNGSGATRVAVLKMISTLNELNRSISQPDDLIFSYTEMGTQYLQLGYSGKAGLTLDKAQSQATLDATSPQGLLKYNLAYAAYLLDIGNVDKCELTLSYAQELALQYFGNADKAQITKDRADIAEMLAQAAMVHSRLALELGEFSDALLYARRNLRLVYRAWDLVAKKSMNRPPRVALTNTEPDSSEEANESASSKSLMSQPPSTEEQAAGPVFWHLVPTLFQSLSWLSQLYAHHGMYQEALYYSEQADRVVRGIGIGTLSAAALISTGNIWLKAGLLDKASEALTKASDCVATEPLSTMTAVIQLQIAQLHSASGNKQASLAGIDGASGIIDGLMDVSYIQNLDRIIDPAKRLAAEMTKLSLAAKKAPVARKAPARGRPAAKKAVPKAMVKPKIPIDVAQSIQDECLGLRSFKGDVLRQKSQILLLWKKFDEATSMLQIAHGTLGGKRHLIDQHIATARCLMAQGLEQLTADPVYSVLQDSTISFPSVTTLVKPTTVAAGKAVTPPKRTIGARTKAAQGSNFLDKLYQAQEHLIEAYANASLTASTNVIHRVSLLLNATTLLVSIAGHSRGKISAHPCFATYSTEMARNIALEREMNACIENTASKQDDLKWPSMITAEQVSPNSCLQSLTQRVANFQKDFIDIIPETWNAISVSLSENQQELCITKMQAGYSPFILRLPLGRENTARDMDEEEIFGFEQGREELREIVDLANESAHGARGLTTKAAKAGWWGDRDILDMRMRDLLDNIEKVWLGGFKGIFSRNTPNLDLLARFQSSFNNILDKHLPSRQRVGRKKVPQGVTLDSRILELFIGLGNPSEPGSDFSEILTDLLYFVVDILQFHGERNAYDEIDWDRVVIDTIGALEHYHEVLLSSSTRCEPRHTILILDKTLHGFPWESIPCLADQAVSRMPSIGALRNRILRMQGTNDQPQQPGHYVSPSKGSYVLNPSNDLVNTSETFTPLLAPLDLPTAQTVIDRAPTEKEFTDLLITSDYLLYFGHGSGTQYIRPKTIRKLRSNIAVSFLMGCSSGALVEVGEFEPYGTPVNYLMAGCPAVVANLWDVTDRDCDRFAIGALDGWGLTSSDSTDRDESHKKRGRSLVEAVVQARERCQYRYLTAAAVCVYGIPVYLK